MPHRKILEVRRGGWTWCFAASGTSVSFSGLLMINHLLVRGQMCFHEAGRDRHVAVIDSKIGRHREDVGRPTQLLCLPDGDL